MDREKWVAIGTAGTVGVVALAAAFLESREAPLPEVAANTAVTSAAVVKAPPLATSLPAKPDTRTMGASPACNKCGVVENVVAVNGQINGKSVAVGYLMNIRMDDGSSRTVEHRGALPAGSRVVVEGESVRARGPSG